MSDCGPGSAAGFAQMALEAVPEMWQRRWMPTAGLYKVASRFSEVASMVYGSRESTLFPTGR